MVTPDETYQLLRHLTSPVVAITSEHGGKRNGMIIDSAIRASIVPTLPRLAMFIHKFNVSHDLIFGSGQFVLHLLRQDQFDLIFLDILLPGVGGASVLKALKRKDPEALVVLITGHPYHDETLTALEFGPAMLLRKPIKLADIHAVLEIVFKE